MIKYRLTENEMAAIVMLRETGVGVLEAAQVACAAMRAGRGRVQRAMKCIVAGEVSLQQLEKTVTFEKAVAVALEARRDRRRRTIYDFRYFTRRFMLRCKGLAKKRVRCITTQDCALCIETAFDTPRQRQKARMILSGVFSTAVKRGWCDANPVAKVESPRVTEELVPILTPEEITDLMTSAQVYRGGSCATAVGMMLYAGIRPNEVSRVTWEQVDFCERAIYILPQHSKTGGARRVTIHKPLLQIMMRNSKSDRCGKICPSNWLRHWRELRQIAGWGRRKRWPQDALRHTFASYHLSHFRSFAELQYEMGHRDTTLLRTRYLNMRGVKNAEQFWMTADKEEHDVLE